MKAAVYTKTKSGKVLEIKNLGLPVPKDNEVVLRVRAASVNPLDWRMKTERPGVDVAGEIVAVGRTVTQFKLGDAVFGDGKGAFAEYACGPESKLAVKPESVSFEQAAAVPIAGLTALQALRDKVHLQPGQKVLINGAAGGIGTFAVQIAKSFGVNVTGVCSTKNVELVRSLGADRVIDYTHDDFTQGSERHDLLLDNVGNRTLSAMKRVLTQNGKCVMTGAPKDLLRGVHPIAQSIRVVAVLAAEVQILYCAYQSSRPDELLRTDQIRKTNSGDRPALPANANRRRYRLRRRRARPGESPHHVLIAQETLPGPLLRFSLRSGLIAKNLKVESEARVGKRSARAWRVCALSIQRLEGSRPGLRQTPALCKLNGVMGWCGGAPELCGGAKQMTRCVRPLATQQEFAKRVPKEGGRKDWFGDEARSDEPWRSTQSFVVVKSGFMRQR